MVAVGSKIVVIPSPELTEIKLGGLLGEMGYVVEDLTDNEATADGYMVLFLTPYKDEYIWYIPEKSVYEQE